MNSYVVYADDGEILRTGTCPAYAVARQAMAGEHVMVGQANDIEDKIVAGEIQRRPQAEIDARTPKPPPGLAPEDRPARITQGQWDALEARVEALEDRDA